MMVLHDNEAAVPAVEQVFVHEIPYAEIALHAGAIPFHNVGYLLSAQSGHDTHLKITAARRVQQKPADEGHPEPAETCTDKKAINSVNDEQERHCLANLRCGPRGTVRVVCDPPRNSAQYTSAVERIARDHIENGQSDVDVSEPQQDSDHWICRFAGWQPASHSDDYHAERANEKACQRSNNCNPEFSLGIASLRLDLRDAAERK